MGNRALITSRAREVEVYLHWNGGWDSVQCFLEYCRLKGYRAPDDDYGWARLCQVIANYFTDLPGSDIFPQGNDDGLSIGINAYGGWDVDFCDNKRYIIDDWRIVAWEYGDGTPVPAENAQLTHDPYVMLVEIDKHQPIQLGREYIRDNMAGWLIRQDDYDTLIEWLDRGAEEAIE